MKEYLENRIKALSAEYLKLLTEVGEERYKSMDIDESTRNKQWVLITDKKSRISELKEALEYCIENNYTNL